MLHMQLNSSVKQQERKWTDRAEDSPGWWAEPWLCSGVTHRAGWIEACDWTAASWNQETKQTEPHTDQNRVRLSSE